jgi:hypothetical protein
MPRKVLRSRIRREPGCIDFVDARGDVARVAAPGAPARRRRVVLRTGLRPEPGYLYYVDRDGDVSRTPLAHPDLRPEG